MVHNTHTPRVKYAVYAHFVGVFDEPRSRGVDAVLDKLRAARRWDVGDDDDDDDDDGGRQNTRLGGQRTHARTHAHARLCCTHTHTRT